MRAEVALRVAFREFIRYQFEASRHTMKSDGQTHRWLFCWDDDDPDSSFDCGCCLSSVGLELESETLPPGRRCECACHARLQQIEEFWIGRLRQYLPRDADRDVPFIQVTAEGPRDDLMVLVWSAVDGYGVASRSKGDWYYHTYRGVKHADTPPTHWTRLPNRPA